MNETEKAVLFYLIDGHDSPRLREDLFPSGSNRTIFREIRARKADGRTVDLALLLDALSPEVPAAEIAGLGDLVIRGPFSETYFQGLVNELLRASKEKDLRAIAGGPPDFIPAIREALASYEGEESSRIEELALPAAAGAFREFYEKKRSSKYWGHEIKSLPSLTRALNGLREIIVLTARPKRGKSTLALQIGSDVASQGVGVLYYDLENGRFNLMAREISRREGIAFQNFFTEKEGPMVEAGVQELEALPNFAIINDRRLTPDRIRVHLLQMTQALAREDHVVIIDSLQKLPMEKLSERRAAVDGWLRAFEGIKADFPLVTILLISELSRDGGRPKESGDIEYSAHFLIALKLSRDKEELPFGTEGEDGTRDLFLQAARDVELPGGPLKLEVDFRHWSFREIEGIE